MAESTSQSQVAGSGTSAGFRALMQSGIAKELGAMALLLLTAFMILSIASFDAADLSGAVYPARAQANNLGGQIGADIVGSSYEYLGVATYLLVGLMGIWAGVIFLRKRLRNWPVKLAGLFLAVAAFAGFFGGLQNGSVVMPSAGGVVGSVIHYTLSSNFGLTGTYLILAFASVASFLLATEAMFYPMVRDFFSTPSDEDDTGGDVDIVFEKTDDTITFSPESNALVKTRKTKEGLLTRWANNLRDFIGSSDGEDEDMEMHLPPSGASAALRLVEDATVDELPDNESGDEIVVDSEVNRVSASKLRKADEEKSEASVPTLKTKPKRKKKRKKGRGNESESEDLVELARTYTNPGVTLLEEGKKADPSKTKREVEHNAQMIVDTLKHFRVDVQVQDIRRGPTITMYEIKPPAGLSLSKIKRLEDELSMMLQAPKIRILAPIPGKNTVGIEVPNEARDIVSLKEVVGTEEFRSAAKKMQLPIALGLDSEGKPLVKDLARAPHLLVAGTTGSGKSVAQNVILMSLLLARHWNEVKLVLVDPKCVELTPYQELGYLAAPVLTDMTKAVGVFEWLVEEMERRYKLFAATRTKKISEFNSLSWAERKKRYESRGGDPNEVPEKMPAIVAMVDELADMMMANSDTRIDELICRIAQKARAAGMHLILATQRPSADVVTGLIKANVPARIGFKLPTGTDSRTILGATGAEKLLGWGDMLVDWNDGKGIFRAQSAFCDTPEIERVCDAVRNQTVEHYLVDTSKPMGASAQDDMIGGQPKHEKFDEAVQVVLTQGRASAQFLRSALRVGYNAATTIVMQMEMAGIIGPSRGSKEREILMSIDEWQALQNPIDNDDYDDEDDYAEAA